MKIEKTPEFLISFAGPKSTSALVALPILAFLSVGALFTETLVNDASQIQLIEMSAVALVVSFGYFLAFGKLINRFTRTGSVSRTSWLVILFFTTEMIRTLFLGWEVLQQNLADQVQWDYRIVAGGLTGVLFFGLRSVVLNDSTRYKVDRNQLGEVQEKLRKSTAVTQADLDKNKNRIINEIRSAVNQALRSVVDESTTNKENTKLIVNELVRVSEEVVRPLSHDLFSDKFAIPIDAEKKKNRNFLGFKIVKLATYVQPFHPTTTALFGLFQFIGLALFLTSNPVNAILTVLGFTVWIFAILFLAKRFIQPKLVQINIFFRIVIINLVFWLMSSFLLLDPRLPSNLMLPRSSEIFLYLFVIGTIIPWLFAVYSAIKFARSEILEDIRQTNEKLNWSNARLGAKLWAEQKKLAAMVHRDIQSALISTALKFKKDVESGVDPDTAARQIRELVEGTSKAIYSEIDFLDPRAEVEKLNNLWDGIFKISVDISAQTNSKILQDKVCLQTVNEFISEFATNSVKHGKASLGDIKIEQVDEKIIKLTMVNNGLPLPTQITHGLGSQMVLQQSLSVVHENLPGGGVYFAATIPIN